MNPRENERTVSLHAFYLRSPLADTRWDLLLFDLL